MILHMYNIDPEHMVEDHPFWFRKELRPLQGNIEGVRTQQGCIAGARREHRVP